MIDFRYHLVSLIAVFLAVALGIVIGTTALNEPILADIENQVTALEQDKRSLEDRTQQLQAQLDTADAFDEAVAPALVDGALAGSSVLLVVTNEDVAAGDRRRGHRADRRGRRHRERHAHACSPSTATPPPRRACRTTSPAPACRPGVQLPETDDAGQLVGVPARPGADDPAGRRRARRRRRLLGARRARRRSTC